MRPRKRRNPRQKRRRKRKRLKKKSKPKNSRRTQRPPSSKRSEAFVLSILDPFVTASGPYNFRKDTSHLLLLGLAGRGHPIFYATPSSLLADEKGARVRASAVTVLPSAPYFRFQDDDLLPLDRFSLILMRKDPPVDSAYLYATRLLSLVSDRIPVINHPEALRNWNEKLVILNFPHWIPPTLVTADKKELDRFVQTVGGTAILKPLEGFATQGVKKLTPGQSDYGPTIDEMTCGGKIPVMVQRYLPEVRKGEKRVFLMEGQPLGALLKTPPEGSFLTNPDLGGHLGPANLTSREKKICADLGLFLKKHKIFLAGIDLIGERLTEINITSPGLVCEWNEVDNQRHEEEMIDRLEGKMT